MTCRSKIKECQGDHGGRGANCRCCIPALAGFVSPRSMGPGKPVSRLNGGFAFSKSWLSFVTVGFECTADGLKYFLACNSRLVNHGGMRIHPIAGVLVIGLACLAPALCSQAQDLVPLKIKLPSPAFVGTPSDTPLSPDVEKPTGVPRPPLMVPPGVVNLALHKPVTTSDTHQIPENLVKIT